MDRPTSARHALHGLLALAVAMGIGRFAFTPILPMMQAEGLLETSGAAWLATANYVGYLLGALSAARLTWSASQAIRAGLATVAAATLAMALPAGIVTWALLRLLAGVASAWVLVFTSAWSLERFQGHARPAMQGATLYSGVGVGIALTGFACLGLLALHATSRMAWLALGVLSALASAALWRAFPGTRAAAPRPGNEAAGRAAGSGLLVACYGAFGFGYIIPATFIAAMAREASPDPAVYGWSWPLFGLAAAVSTFVGARMGAGRGPRAMWRWSQALMAVGVALPLLSRGILATLACGILVGGTFMVVTMAGMQEARRVGGEAARSLMAAMTAAFATGQIVGPLVVAAVPVGGGYAVALAAAAAALALSAAALFRRTRPEETP